MRGGKARRHLRYGAGSLVLCLLLGLAGGLFPARAAGGRADRHGTDWRRSCGAGAVR